jgi:DNA-binding NarL/FixJ family response regulator
MDPRPPLHHRHATRVLCVDDSRDTAAVLRMLIDAESSMQCVGCLTTAGDLLEEVRRLSPPPDVVILDATMPGKDPLASMSELAAQFPKIRTIIYSGYDDPELIDRALSAGAWGCISKREDPDTIMRAVRDAAAGNPWRPRPRRRA